MNGLDVLTLETKAKLNWAKRAGWWWLTAAEWHMSRDDVGIAAAAIRELWSIDEEVKDPNNPNVIYLEVEYIDGTKGRLQVNAVRGGFDLGIASIWTARG